MSKRIDPDVLALKRCVKALHRCTSHRTLMAALTYLVDYFDTHPSRELPERLRRAGLAPKEDK